MSIGEKQGRASEVHRDGFFGEKLLFCRQWLPSRTLQRFFEDKCFRQIDAFDPNSCFSVRAMLHLLGGKSFEPTMNHFIRFVNGRQKQKQKMFLAGLLFSANFLCNTSGCAQENHAPEFSVSVLVDTFQHDMSLSVRYISGLWRY